MTRELLFPPFFLVACSLWAGASYELRVTSYELQVTSYKLAFGLGRRLHVQRVLIVPELEDAAEPLVREVAVKVRLTCSL